MRSALHALVTGASGTVGPTLVRHLLEEGYHVRVLLRSEPESGLLPAAAEPVRGDVTDPTSLAPAVDGVNTVFHLAAKLHINNPAPDLEAEYERVNVQGTEHLARAAATAGVQRFIYFSTINVYGASQRGVVYTESSPVAPETFYARTKLQAERIVLSQHPAATVLRLAAVYGPRMRGNYPLLLRALEKGVAVMVGDGENRRTLVNVEDVARAAVAVIRSEEAVGKIYNVTDGKVHTFDEIACAIQQALGKPECMLYLPAGPIRLGLAALAQASRAVHLRAPFGPSLVDKLTEDMAVSGERLQRELDFRPAYSLGEGWAAAIGETRSPSLSPAGGATDLRSKS